MIVKQNISLLFVFLGPLLQSFYLFYLSIFSYFLFSDSKRHCGHWHGGHQHGDHQHSGHGLVDMDMNMVDMDMDMVDMDQDQGSGSGSRIRIKDQDQGSGSRIRIKDQDQGLGSPLLPLLPTKSPPSKSRSHIVIFLPCLHSGRRRPPLCRAC